MTPPTPSPSSGFTLSFRPGDVTRALAAVAAVLVGLSIAGQVLKFVTGHDVAKGFIPLFHVATEGNVTTYFSALLLLFAALLLAFIGWQERIRGGRHSHYWLGLACLFTYLSVDEAAALHELVMDPLREMLGVGGLLYFAWVIPGFVLVVLVSLAVYPFVRELPGRTAGLFLLAGALFVGGALGMELLGGLEWERHGGRTMFLSMLTTIEETMEISGVLVFIHALILHIHDATPKLRLHLRGSSSLSAEASRSGLPREKGTGRAAGSEEAHGDDASVSPKSDTDPTGRRLLH